MKQEQERNLLITTELPTVARIARRLKASLPGRVDIEELIGEGQLALVESARQYDPGMGTTFRSWARWRVRGAMLDYIRRETRRAASTTAPRQ